MAIGLLYRPFLAVAREAGVDVDAILASVGLTEAMVHDPITRLSPDRGRELGRRIIAAVGDPEIGLRAAERVRLSDTHLVGYLIRHTPHPLAALEELARYGQLLGDTADVRIERRRGEVSVTFGLSSGRQMLPEGADYAIGAVFRIVVDLSSGEARPISVRLARPRPPRPAPYRHFFGCPVTFEMLPAELKYEHRSLVVPFPAHDSELLSILEARADTVLATLPKRGTMVERVRTHIAQNLEGGDCSLQAIAAEFSMSERTLRRRLQEGGNGYRAILDGVRREHALALIELGQEPVTTVALRTGFADTAAFTRAFRRWTGRAPGSHRRG